jgi:hypothetical protein
MPSVERLDQRLDAVSDRLSPLVIKEVRQFVRGREFLISFTLSLVIALIVAAYGSAQAMSGSTTAGRSTFGTLLACLALLGCAAVPIGAFSTLRTERLEQTLDLIALTSLSPRHIVIGKLLAQGAKLATFFAVMAPFVATSFLLGGVDFVTISLALGAVFLWSMWIAAAALCVSAMVTSRVASGLVFGVFGVVLLISFTLGQSLLLSPFGLRRLLGVSGLSAWSSLLPMIFGLVTMANLVLLAENRLSPPSESRVAPLRIGLFIQFLFIIGWALSRPLTAAISTGAPPSMVLSLQVGFLAGLGGLHLALVAFFSVTEGPSEARPRRAPGDSRPVHDATSRDWRWLLSGGSAPAALYMLIQVVIFVGAAYLLGGGWEAVRWFLAICGAICLFTGLPSYVIHCLGWWSAPKLAAQGLILVLVFLSLILPDLLYFVLLRPEDFDLDFSTRHLFSPLRTLFNWTTVESSGWFAIPALWSALGFGSYLVLLRRARSQTPAAVSVPMPMRDDQGV